MDEWIGTWGVCVCMCARVCVCVCECDSLIVHKGTPLDSTACLCACVCARVCVCVCAQVKNNFLYSFLQERGGERDQNYALYNFSFVFAEVRSICVYMCVCVCVCM